MPIPYPELATALQETPLFDQKTWRLSPEAWPLSQKQLDEIKAAGQACAEFVRAVEVLYTRSWQGKNILRNRELKAPWVAEYLDRGKPTRLIEHSRAKALRNQMPVVIRPDFLQTEDGYALTEIDSVPGGIGLTSFLNRLYGTNDPDIVGGDAMPTLFYKAMAALAPDKSLPLICILVSDEAATYRPEMDWLANELQKRGLRVYCRHTSDLIPLGDTFCVDVEGNPEEVDVIYRFWELFDLPNLPVMESLMGAIEEGRIAVAPPMRHFQEEKLNLALFHHHLLEDFWRENLSRKSFKLLSRYIPKSWVMDPVELPPNAVLDGPWIGGKPMHRWEQLAGASQKERNLILKLSGFHENAWGARSVLFGSDASRNEWESGIKEALEGSAYNLHVLQEYRKPVRLKHPVYEPDPGEKPAPETFPMQGRVRICPYYFVIGDEVELGGVLATFCPADKKIIHGMRDAAMLPCALKADGAEEIKD